MEDKHRTILRDYRPKIVKDLEPNNILPDLGRVFTVNDDEEIKAQSTRQKRCEKLLEILPRKGPNAFKVFVEALIEEAKHLADVLIEADHKETDKELRQVREQSANLRRENCELKKELEAEKQDHTKTSQELKELKSLHETFKTETSQQIGTLAAIVQELTGDSCSSGKALGNWRDSTERETQTLGMEIEELTQTILEMIRGYQVKIKAQRKRLQDENVKLSKKLMAANEKHQREIEDLRVKNNESKEVVMRPKNELEKSQRDLKEIKNDLANERDRVIDYQQKLEEARKAADDPLKLRPKNEKQQVPKENKSHRKKPSEERRKFDNLKKGVHRWRLTSKPQMPGGIKSYSKDFDKGGDVYGFAILGIGKSHK